MKQQFIGLQYCKCGISWKKGQGFFERTSDMAFVLERVFLDTCTVLNDTLAWDIDGNRDNTTCLDIDPDTLYELPAVEEKDSIK